MGTGCVPCLRLGCLRPDTTDSGLALPTRLAPGRETRHSLDGGRRPIWLRYIRENLSASALGSVPVHPDDLRLRWIHSCDCQPVGQLQPAWIEDTSSAACHAVCDCFDCAVFLRLLG